MNIAFRTVMMKAEDKVAVALMSIPEGSQVQVTCQNKSFCIEIKQDIEFGHKFAVESISQGEDIIKYGEVIGSATVDIEPGEHVHVHNLEGKRGRGDKVEFK
ncbi:UxaA family hydrolase (plasmid) [Priestia megaterium]|jgi:altronate dehydratase small subunit|uniref:UxaA family hydrolase n=1 Tax=Priestia megaterium TaxID=1404 RepID=UPI000EB6EB47|nr:UxaA family hydrolase [Priestia megaterium]AYE53688.1 UxaA family hydrolase [Priestia megaterium NCT-2]MDN4634492.1 UxaA family hydrolase [Sphingomonas sp. PsM26]HWL24884.1 UxaA family hydrolase [Ureibacillus sp.]